MCSSKAEIKFEKVDNGIMLNCYPESNLILYPDLFKIAKVIPIYKKDNPLLCENY